MHGIIIWCVMHRQLMPPKNITTTDAHTFRRCLINQRPTITPKTARTRMQTIATLACVRCELKFRCRRLSASTRDNRQQDKSISPRTFAHNLRAQDLIDGDRGHSSTAICPDQTTALQPHHHRYFNAPQSFTNKVGWAPLSPALEPTTS